jgi:HEAT repeat protein
LHSIDPLSGPTIVDLMRLRRDVPGLIEVLSMDQDSRLRADAAFYLGQLGDHSANPTLRMALGDPVDLVKWHAACALVRLGDFQVMLQFMGDQRPPFMPMMEMLNFYPWEWVKPLGEGAVGPVVKELEHPLSYKFVLMGADLILQYQDNRLVPVLWELLKHEDYRIRAVAAHKLGYLPEDGSIARLIAVLSDEVGVVAERAADALVMIGRAAMPALRQAAKGKDKNVRAQAKAIIERLRVEG